MPLLLKQDATQATFELASRLMDVAVMLQGLAMTPEVYGVSDTCKIVRSAEDSCTEYLMKFEEVTS